MSCDHKFVDSKHCLKCGWEIPDPKRAAEALAAGSPGLMLVPPPAAPTEPTDEELSDEELERIAWDSGGHFHHEPTRTRIERRRLFNAGRALLDAESKQWETERHRLADCIGAIVDILELGKVGRITSTGFLCQVEGEVRVYREKLAAGQSQAAGRVAELERRLTRRCDEEISSIERNISDADSRDIDLDVEDGKIAMLRKLRSWILTEFKVLK